MSYMDELNFWLNDDYFDQKTKDELLAIRNNEAEVEDRFYKELEFGTGGLRGVIGAGTNRMNVYTVRKATQGLANYIIKRGTQSKGVAIAFDSRRMSPEFSDEAARCLAANGIKAYIFESLRPTPELSFALRTLGCTAGIVVTASHNPPENLGYMGRLCYTQNATAVTGACLLVKKSLYEQVGGLDESFVISLNDVDFCLKLRKLGLLNVWTPFAELYHYESISRGLDDQGEKAERYNKESEHFREKWKAELEAGDPYYNPNFSLDRSDYALRDPVSGR